MSEKIIVEFKERIRKIADEEIERYCSAIAECFPIEKGKVAKDFSDALTDLMELYATLQREKVTGPLKWVYISFLRTSIVNHDPVLRLDLYDDRGRISTVECAATWKCPFIFKHLDSFRASLDKEFSAQNQVGRYVLDDLVLEAADTLFECMVGLFPETIQCGIDKGFLLIDKNVKIMAGEFLDKSIQVYGEADKAVDSWDEDDDID